MDCYYTGIELGTDSIKVLVCNKINDEFHVIANVSSPSSGIKKGNVVDIKAATSATKKAIKRINEMLGIRVTKALACIPTDECRMDIVVGSITLNNSSEITGDDVSEVIKNSIKGHVDSDEEVVTAMPISFKVDDNDNIKDPKGMNGDILEAKVLITKSPKSILYKILEVMRLSGIEVMDIAYKSTGDYYSVKNSYFDKEVTSIINIGEDTTNISVFNKGIMIKNKIINVGSRNIDNDLSYIYKIDKKLSRKLKEKFVVADSDYSDVNELCELTTLEGKKIEQNQLELSKVVEARCKEILKIAKKELKNLTNREIRYIIVTGGVSELAGFQYLVEDSLGIKAKVCNITTIGIRHNKYSSILGVIKYFDSKISFSEKKVNFINESDINSLITIKQNKDNNDSIMNKVFGRFFEN